jgi:hypothetical protein
MGLWKMKAFSSLSFTSARAERQRQRAFRCVHSIRQGSCHTQWELHQAQRQMNTAGHQHQHASPDAFWPVAKPIMNPEFAFLLKQYD